MTTKKTTTKKTVKKSTEPERYIKVYFTEQGIGIDGHNISTMNHIEAILGIMYSLYQNDADFTTVRGALDAIDYHRKTINGRKEMIAQLEHLRDVLQEARKKAEAQVKKTKENNNQKEIRICYDTD